MDNEYEIIQILLDLGYCEIDMYNHPLALHADNFLSSLLFKKNYEDIEIEILINKYYMIRPDVLIFKKGDCIYHEDVSVKDIKGVVKKVNRDIIIDSLD